MQFSLILLHGVQPHLYHFKYLIRPIEYFYSESRTIRCHAANAY